MHLENSCTSLGYTGAEEYEIEKPVRKQSWMEHSQTVGINLGSNILYV